MQKLKLVHFEPGIYILQSVNGPKPKKEIFAPLFRDNCVEKQSAYTTMMNVDAVSQWAREPWADPL